MPVKMIVQLFIVTILLPFLPLIISGKWDWWEAWVCALVYIGGFVISRALVRQRHPDLIAERAKILDHADAKAWDKILAPVAALGFALILLAAGLQARLGDLVSIAGWLKALALALMLGGYALGTWAMLANRFFSGVVRIQTERGHTVVSGGPYRWLRHPGYAGALLTYLATPFWLASTWALAAALLTAVALVVRTALEDRTLQAELPGYAEYARRTRYRLLPGVW